MTSLGGSPPLDILIRSSGVKRLSDFLMWQVCSNFSRSIDRPMAHKLFVGFRECSASFHSDILARFRVLGHVTHRSGLSDKSVESAGEQLGTRTVDELWDRIWYVPGL